jgi:hypothetical protein
MLLTIWICDIINCIIVLSIIKGTMVDIIASMPAAAPKDITASNG